MESNYDFADERRWTLMQLHLRARELSFTKETIEIPRQRDEADRALGHVAFEMWARRHHDRQLETPPAPEAVS